MKHSALALLCTTLFAAPVAQAVIVLQPAIVWNAPVTISGDTDVLTGGTLAYAYNFGQNASATTINSVPFASFSGAGDTNGTASVGNVSIESRTTTATTNNLGFFVLTTSYPAPYGALSAQYQSMLGGLAFVNLPGTSNSLRLTLGGLTNGQAYQVQFWVNDPRSAIGSLSESITSGGSTSGTLDVNTTNADGGVGQFIVGAFTASTSSQEFLFARTDNGGPGPGQEINGFQLRAVPESSTIALFTGSLGFVLLRRTRQRSQS